MVTYIAVQLVEEFENEATKPDSIDMAATSKVGERGREGGKEEGVREGGERKEGGRKEDGGREGIEKNFFVPLQKGRRKRKGSVAMSDSHSGLDWTLERVKVVEVMCEMVESDLSLLWEPPSPQMMEDFNK